MSCSGHYKCFVGSLALIVILFSRQVGTAFENIRRSKLEQSHVSPPFNLQKDELVEGSVNVRKIFDDGALEQEFLPKIKNFTTSFFFPENVCSRNCSRSCSRNCSRSLQLTSGVGQRFIPLFVKFHKVGSGTVAEVFRRHCGAVSRRIGFSNGTFRKSFASENRSQLPVDSTPSTFPWRPRPGVFCGKTPHEHASLRM
jgi:hypothetical protein